MAGIIEKFWKSKRQVVQIKIIRRLKSDEKSGEKSDEFKKIERYISNKI